MLNYIALTFGFIVCFFVIGFVFIEVFFPHIIFRLKFPLYFIASMLVSTYLMYLVGLFFGLSRTSVLYTFLLIIPIFIYKLTPRLHDFGNYFKNHFRIIILSLIVLVIYLVALNPAILSLHDDYFVMAGSNWQDTAMHLAITESLTQGNFPPLAPYFSGQPLSYYYFSDFHSAIIAILSDDFYPKIFVVSNSILAFVLCLSIYSLAFEISKNRKISGHSALLGTFFSSYLSIKFLDDILIGGKLVETIANKSYSMEYDKVFGMSNMADYYLQNRPMMIGIPVFTIFVAVTINAFKNKDLKLVLLSGILVGMLVKFQFFTVLACCIAFGFISIFNFKKQNWRFKVKSIFYFFIPILILYFVFGLKSVNSQSFIDLIKNNFHFGPWDINKSLWWHLSFIFLNLGLPFIFTILSLFAVKNSKIKFITSLALLFILIPYLVCFTPAEGDMLKFFYFGVVLFSVISINLLHKVIKGKFALYFCLTVLIVTSTFSSFLTLGNSYLNKNSGYSVDAYNAGLWVRGNTPQKSVFVTMPTVHSAPTDIGGRLRVISYINWPYSHGFNYGEDNVFTRAEDVEDVFRTGDTEQVKLKYKADYIFYGEDEVGQFPDAEKLFSDSNKLKLIYDQGKIKVYKII